MVSFAPLEQASSVPNGPEVIRLGAYRHAQPKTDTTRSQERQQVDPQLLGRPQRCGR